MSEERVQFIKEEMAAGKSVDEIRQAAITRGYDTEDFEADLAAATHDTAVVSTEAATIATESANTLIRPMDLIGQSFQMAKDSLSLLGGFALAALALIVTAMLFFAIFMVATGFAGGNAILMAVVGIPLYLVLIAGSMIVITGLIYAFAKRSENVGYWQGFEWAFSHFWPIFWISVLMQLAIHGALLFLVIPALVLSLYLMFAFLVYIAEEEKGMSALLRSTQLVYGNWWGITGRSLLFVVVLLGIFLLAAAAFAFFGMVLGGAGLGFILGIIGAIAFVAGYLFLLGWGLSFSVVLFESLRSYKPNQGDVWNTMPTVRKLYVALAVIGIPVFILLQAVSVYSDQNQEPEWNFDEAGFESLEAQIQAEIESELRQQLLEIEAQN